MKLILSQKNYTSQAFDLLIVPISSTKLSKESPLTLINSKSNNSVKTLIKESFIEDKKGSLTVLPKTDNHRPIRTVFVHIGSSKETSYDKIRHAVGTAIRKLPTTLDATIGMVIPTLNLDENLLTQAMVEGFVLGNYSYLEQKSKPEKTSIKSLTIFGKTSLKKAANKGLVSGEAGCLARDLANAPANLLTPALFVKKAKDLLKKSDIKIEVIDEKKAEALKMNSFLSVGKGSSEPSYMLVMRYQPNKKEKPIALVGKGVTFDTGGVSLKPSKGMGDMKADMSGAASVLATMVAVSKLKPKKNILAVIPLAENMNSSSATKPGDVITAMNGKTIEILNTDAEGRLVLADALCYAEREGAKVLIDIATLTGACCVALGKEAGAILGTDQGKINTFIKNSDYTGERLWQLPLYDEFLDYMKSNTADIANSSETRYAGTSTAAIFLKEFTNDVPWVHLDIASLMASTSTKGYHVKGMAGPGVRNFIEFLT
jgi:leucyl aminopeptidase